MKKISHKKETTITGYLEARQWDENDNVTGIKILTEYDEYLLDMSGLGRSLLPFLDEEMEISGIVTSKKDGIKHIKVTGYHLIEEGVGYDSFLDLDEDYGFCTDDIIYDEYDDEYLH